MRSSNLSYYVKKLTRLKQGITKYGKAPHKPVLLISLIELIERGEVSRNVFELNATLVAEFKDNWTLLVSSGNTCDFSLPFYHLQNDGVWHVYLKSGGTLKAHVRSIFTLQTMVSYAALDGQLFALLLDGESRAILLNALLDKYFATAKAHFLQAKRGGNQWLQYVKQQVLLEGQQAPAMTEDDDVKFVRSYVFKQEVPRIYNNTCCISGMKVIPLGNYSMIDACHIVPFSETHDDTIINGLALCPNLHRAFDRHLLSIDENYRVIVSKNFEEQEAHPYSLRGLQGTKILLPDNPHFWPSQEKLQMHREKTS